MKGSDDTTDRTGTEALLRARAKLLAHTGDAHARAAATVGPEELVVSVEGGRYALPLDDLTRVAPLVSLTPLPGTPPYVAGLAFVLGRIVTVVDLGVLLGHRPSRLGAVVLLDVAGEAVALGIERYDTVRPGGTDELTAPPAPLSEQTARYLRGLGPDGVGHIDIARLGRDLVSPSISRGRSD